MSAAFMFIVSNHIRVAMSASSVNEWDVLNVKPLNRSVLRTKHGDADDKILY